MKEIAQGRKDILKVLGLMDWRTVMDWKRRDPGFRKLIRRHPITGRPFVIVQEIIDWMTLYEK